MGTHFFNLLWTGRLSQFIWALHSGFWIVHEEFTTLICLSRIPNRDDLSNSRNRIQWKRIWLRCKVDAIFFYLIVLDAKLPHFRLISYIWSSHFCLLLVKRQRTDRRDVDGIFADEQSQLIGLYESTCGSKWHRKDNWSCPVSVEEWYGLTLKRGRVIDIHLGKNNLKGSIHMQLLLFSWSENPFSMHLI